MKIQGDTIIFEKLVEASPAKREGSRKSQIISIPQPAGASSHINARGSFSTDISSMVEGMARLSGKAASLDLKRS